MLPGFLGVIAIFLAIPGPDMAFMVATGLSGGRGAAARAALGIAAGVGVYVTLTAAGLAALLAAVPAGVHVIRVAGAGYLLFLAWRAWHTDGTILAIDEVPLQPFRRGFLVNLSNPKIVVFFTALLPQFLGRVHGSGPTLQFMMLGLVLLLLGLAIDLLICYAAGSMHQRVLQSPIVRRRLQRTSSVIYGSLGTALLADTARGLSRSTGILSF